MAYIHVKVRHAPLPAVMPGYWFKLGPGFEKIFGSAHLNSFNN